MSRRPRAFLPRRVAGGQPCANPDRPAFEQPPKIRLTSGLPGVVAGLSLRIRIGEAYRLVYWGPVSRCSGESFITASCR
jgi:hypothetical protein